MQPKKIIIIPAEICKYFVGNFWKQQVDKNAQKEQTKQTIPITNAETKIFIGIKYNVIPATQASILVATYHKQCRKTQNFMMFIVIFFLT